MNRSLHFVLARREGFTLIESLVAIAMIAVLLGMHLAYGSESVRGGQAHPMRQ